MEAIEKKVSPWFIRAEYGNRAEFCYHAIMQDHSFVASTWGGTEFKESERVAKLIAASPTMYAYIQKRASEGDKEAQQIISSCE
jgi:hypothetical protein